MLILLRLLVRCLYRFRAFNEGVLATPGPVLLVPNHVSWLDWLFVGVCLAEDWRFVTSSVTAGTSWVHRWLMINRRTFPIDTSSPYAVKRMAEYLQGGGRLVLFAEGRISTTGALMKLYDGIGFLLHKTSARVIPCYIRGAARLPWVKHPGWTRWFPRLSVHFGQALEPPRVDGVTTAEARQKLTVWLRDQMVLQQFQTEMEFGAANVLAAVAEMARQRPHFVVLEDATRKTLTYRRLWLGADLLARRWSAILSSESRVGVLLPNVSVTPLVLLSLWASGKIPAVLNFSTGTPTMLACAQLAGIRQLITSRRFLERAKIAPDPFLKAGVELIFVEDVRAQVTKWEALVALIRHRCGFAGIPLNGSPAATAVILFTSGSEGAPKGVELTHRNLLANVRQMLAVADISDQERMFNALPLFHSFGLTIGTLLPLIRGLYTFIYPSPLHYRMVPTVVYDRNCTILLATNTFLNGYARKAHGYDFHKVRYLFAAAEKLQEATANLWARRFGVRILEGYGATECSPCVSVNVPMLARHATVGRLIPAMQCRLEPVEGVVQGGRLMVRGPNVMRGYLNAEANAKFQALNGWYDTGDIAAVDADGFIQILGRLKRFAKVSGEMVSLTAVEDALAGAFPHYGLRCQVAVLSRPDEDKGEALIAVTNESHLQLTEIRAAIRSKGLTNLCVPREVKYVREIPKLGTGKVNHRELEKYV